MVLFFEFARAVPELKFCAPKQKRGLLGFFRTLLACLEWHQTEDF